MAETEKTCGNCSHRASLYNVCCSHSSKKVKKTDPACKDWYKKTPFREMCRAEGRTEAAIDEMIERYEYNYWRNRDDN